MESLSNERKNKRPLDTENLTMEQEEKVVGGTAGFNTANLNMAGFNTANFNMAGLNTANFNMPNSPLNN